MRQDKTSEKIEALRTPQEVYFQKYREGLQQLSETMTNNTTYGQRIFADIETPQTYEEFSDKIPIISQEQVRNQPMDFLAHGDESLYKKHSGGTSGKSKEFYWPESDFLVEFTSDVQELIKNAKSPVSVHGDWESTDFQVVDSSLKAIRPDIEIAKFINPEQFLKKISGHDVAFYEEDVQSLKSLLFGLQKLKQDNDPLLENLKGVKFIIEPGTEVIPFSDLQAWHNIFTELTGIEPSLFAHYSQIDSGLIGLYKYSPEHSPNDYKYKITDKRFVEVIDQDTGESVSDMDGAIVVSTFRRNGTVLMRYDTGDKGKIEFDDDGFAYLSNIERREEQGMLTFWGSKLFVGELYDRLANQLAELPVRIAFSVKSRDEVELDKILKMDVYVPEIANDEEVARINEAVNTLHKELKTSGNEDLRPFFSNDTGQGARISIDHTVIKSDEPPLHKRWSVRK